MVLSEDALILFAKKDNNGLGSIVFWASLYSIAVLQINKMQKIVTLNFYNNETTAEYHLKLSIENILFFRDTLTKKMRSLSDEELIDLANMARILGYSGFSESMDMAIRPRGYRILNKIHRLPATIIENLVNYFENFQEIVKASIEDLDEVEGIGEIRATYIKNGLIKMQQLVLLDRHI
jgi:hypothetical protein